MTPDEVRMMDNRYALLFIRGERPVQDFKYDILKHPNVGGSTDGHGIPFDHGETEMAVGSVSLMGSAQQAEQSPQSEPESSYGLFTEDDLENYFMKLEEQQHEKPA